MDPLRFAIAAVPLGSYLLLLGLLNLRTRPVLVTGAADLATLGMALTGLIFVGPIALFRPDAATVELGDFVWLFLLAFYWLWVTLAAMLCRPRLVVYNLSAEELRPVLSEAVRKLDGSGRWAGESLVLPQIGVNCHLDTFAWMRNTSLIASGGRQDLAGWRRLGRSVERALRGVAIRPNPRGWLLLGAGVALVAAAMLRLTADPRAVAVSWGQLFAF
ncbi:hypothetical protein Pla108_16670 [Botrimarina colliarenosi]|uniref:Uncharacterized protein n=1 Tax=Botrimarina colliarenosi TaxID=2528001 RepID=A0A5C6AL11_9BACT|nr:hypothetical protein [Botrimarina colliarenosi]TWU00715.1 hypothetical protein Pla108_16670 [Botrimarina colliarenosi]